jgi:hypothetical protein
MQDDLRAGHPTEVDELQGAVIAIAQKAGQAAPISQALWDLVKAAEQGASPRLTVADVRSRVLAANQNVFRDRAEPGL